MNTRTLHIYIIEECPQDLNIFVCDTVVVKDCDVIFTIELSNIYITPDGVFYTSINKFGLRNNSPPQEELYSFLLKMKGSQWLQD